MTDPIRIKYSGRVLELSREASLRIRKEARETGRTVEATVVDLLKNARYATPGLFLPARC